MVQYFRAASFDATARAAAVCGTEAGLEIPAPMKQKKNRIKLGRIDIKHSISRTETTMFNLLQSTNSTQGAQTTIQVNQHLIYLDIQCIYDFPKLGAPFYY